MKKFLFNNKILRDRRRDLRKKETTPEEILWSAIRNRKLNDLKFYRQYSVGPYILDFYCSQSHLAIELDGDSHDNVNSKIYDAERTEYLRSLGIREIRFKNEEVIADIRKILEKIKKHPKSGST